MSAYSHPLPAVLTPHIVELKARAEADENFLLVAACERSLKGSQRAYRICRRAMRAAAAARVEQVSTCEHQEWLRTPDDCRAARRRAGYTDMMLMAHCARMGTRFDSGRYRGL